MEQKIATYEPYAPIIVKLLQGAVYNDNQRIWSDLITYRLEISKYFEKIAIELIIEKEAGYAFIRQMPIDDDNNTIGLIRRTTLKYELSLLCIFLRLQIDDFETSNNEQTNLYISHKKLREDLEMFFKDKSNKVKVIKDFDGYIKQAEELDFLKRINKEDVSRDEIQYEVRSIIKAKITNDVLEEFKRKLQKDVKEL